jgi:hypothetical protein
MSTEDNDLIFLQDESHEYINFMNLNDNYPGIDES